MANGVIKVSGQVIDEMKRAYQQSIQPTSPTGSVFTAKIDGCVITAYKSGKVLFQGKNADAEVRKWESKGQKQGVKKTTSQAKTHPFSPPENISGLSIIGSDEVGTGDYFGPITVSAAYVRKDQLDQLKQIGVKDSKHLNDNQIVQIAKEIRSLITYSLLILPNEKYNDLQQSGMSQGKMKALLHNQAINHVLEKIKPEEPDGFLIDQFVQPDIYFNHIRGKKMKMNKDRAFFATKAEGIHLSVAAASIIARYAFVKEFEKLSEAVGFTIPKGAGAQVDKAAAKLIQAEGMDSINQFAKVHFANTEKAKKLAGV